jgi:hypothetical protein
VVRLEERAFDAATALSGSGPAFLALIIEAFEDAGIVSGLSYADARALILTTVTGTAGLMREEDMPASALRRMVTSPAAPRRRPGRDGAPGRARRHHRRGRGGHAPGRRARLAAVISTLVSFLTALYYVYTILILLYIIMSWVQLPYNVWIGGCGRSCTTRSSPTWGCSAA